jgi:hypothetical protein
MTGSAFNCGDRVILNGDFRAVVEEVIHQRGRETPVYLVQYWNQGYRIDLRVEADEIEHVGGAA